MVGKILVLPSFYVIITSNYYGFGGCQTEPKYVHSGFGNNIKGAGGVRSFMN